MNFNFCKNHSYSIIVTHFIMGENKQSFAATILPEENISTQPITRAMQISEYMLILKSAI